MAAYYFETSALVKRYVRETGTAWVIGLIAPVARNTIYVSPIVGVEVISAITRRKHRGEIAAADAAVAVIRLRRDLTAAYSRTRISAPLIAQAMDLVEVYSLRAYDAVQLASALRVQSRRHVQALPPITFICADTDLNAAARAEGLTVDDPNAHL